MAVEVHVQGQIEPGRLADFREAVRLSEGHGVRRPHVETLVEER